jgi:hypothetical protein
MEASENFEKNNPNSIFELLGFRQGDVETFPNRVYRSVSGDAAIEDLIVCGEVRNKQSAGQTEKSRWGETVYWSRGCDEKYHNVQEGGYVIEAPHNVASERSVTIDDITAIYFKDQDEVRDILEEVLSRSLK